METTVMDQQTQEAETEAIKQVIATIQHSQQNELPDEFVGLFRADAIWTTGHGKRLTGRDEISAFTHKVLPGAMKDSTATYEVVHVLFIRPDVAAVKAQAQYWTLEGQPIGNAGTPLYVMAKEDGQWRLVACQNTEVFAE
ncbi:SgcJ/EcaC family oxidoreductase [Streptomyces sp. IB201691-2A2]|uniref:SgcJ/EcaC family oxidoreductase n=1 Tax=Streptomyces sp. IB201691-2A2 TaxID=2561920 RepID=UPI0021B0C3F3|nr:SgcJ/EcaC family oxidoreductase [Streptomyces sp. IB201691-2A2]